MGLSVLHVLTLPFLRTSCLDTFVSCVDAGAPASTLDTKVSRQEVLKKGNVNTCSTDNPIV